MKTNVTFKIVNEDLFNELIRDIDTSGLSSLGNDYRGNVKGFKGDLEIEETNEQGWYTVSGEFGVNDYADRFGFILCKKEFIICDNTDNSNKPYIGLDDNNTGDRDTAKTYDSEEEAEDAIKENNWSDWAYIEEK
jgi:hypothetical protein